MQQTAPSSLRVSDLVVGFGRQVVIDHLSLDVRQEIPRPSGASGASVLTTIIGLVRGEAEIEVMGKASGAARIAAPRISQDDGVSCSSRALPSLTVRQRYPVSGRGAGAVARPDGRTRPPKIRNGWAMPRTRQVSAELSGGMTSPWHWRARSPRSRDRVSRRADLGLDPIAARFDALIKTLQKTLSLTVFMVTHDPPV
jgi:phospholipid/cholesterol/gamma-HCH transport system ATP-binding protein